MNLLKKTSRQIAQEYRERVAFVNSLPPEIRWTYGAELKTLKAAFEAVKEAEQLRRN